MSRKVSDLMRGRLQNNAVKFAPGNPGPVRAGRLLPAAYCRLPVRATPKGLCKAILDVYGDPHPSTLDA